MAFGIAAEKDPAAQRSHSSGTLHPSWRTCILVEGNLSATHISEFMYLFQYNEVLQGAAASAVLRSRLQPSPPNTLWSNNLIFPNSHTAYPGLSLTSLDTAPPPTLNKDRPLHVTALPPYGALCAGQLSASAAPTLELRLDKDCPKDTARLCSKWAEMNVTGLVATGNHRFWLEWHNTSDDHPTCLAHPVNPLQASATQALDVPAWSTVQEFPQTLQVRDVSDALRGLPVSDLMDPSGVGEAGELSEDCDFEMSLSDIADCLSVLGKRTEKCPPSPSQTIRKRPRVREEKVTCEYSMFSLEDGLLKTRESKEKVDVVKPPPPKPPARLPVPKRRGLELLKAATSRKKKPTTASSGNQSLRQMRYNRLMAQGGSATQGGGVTVSKTGPQGKRVQSSKPLRQQKKDQTPQTVFNIPEFHERKAALSKEIRPALSELKDCDPFFLVQVEEDIWGNSVKRNVSALGDYLSDFNKDGKVKNEQAHDNLALERQGLHGFEIAPDRVPYLYNDEDPIQFSNDKRLSTFESRVAMSRMEFASALPWGAEEGAKINSALKNLRLFIKEEAATENTRIKEQAELDPESCESRGIGEVLEEFRGVVDGESNECVPQSPENQNPNEANSLRQDSTIRSTGTDLAWQSASLRSPKKMISAHQVSKMRSPVKTQIVDAVVTLAKLDTLSESDKLKIVKSLKLSRESFS